MKNVIRIGVLVAAGLALSACVVVEPGSDPAAGSSVGSGSRGATSAAESACMSAVNRNYGGRVRNLTVVRSEFSQANSEVILDADGERWRCLSSNDGVVADLSMQ